jgi:hypothetical protein
MRGLATFAVALTVVAPAWGQSSVYSAAVPPSDADLARLNLTTEWSLYLPVSSRSDSVTSVQVVDGGQVFARTRSGQFLALDARTGQRQWSFAFTGGRGMTTAVAVNSRYVFVAHLSTLYCFHRRTGLLEFAYEPSIRIGQTVATITSAPVCDEANVYVVMGYQDVLAFRLPRTVTQPDPVTAKMAEGMPAGSMPKNPADVIADRYPGRTMTTQAIDPPTRSRGFSRPDVSANPHQVSPSIGVLPSVTKPYEFKDRDGQSILRVESLTLLNSLRHPFQIYDGERRYVVKTPSITVIPPSVARAFELNDIRPKGVEPTKVWRYEATSRVAFEPVIVGPRMWLTFATPRALALDRLDLSTKERIIQTDGRLSDVPSTGLAADGTVGYLALADGSVTAIDLAFGGTNNAGALRQLWRANVGGNLNRPIVLTPTAAFVAGTATGVGRVDRAAGVLTFRTASEDDVLLAVTDETAFTRDRNGTVRAYPLAAPADPITRRVMPAGELALPGFGLPVTNAVNDRILLASDNGLLVCLRDAAPKYAVPRPNLPPKQAPPKAAPAATPPADGAPVSPETPPPANPMTPADPPKS